MSDEIPETQRAVQLVGPDELVLNPAKPVPRPGPRQLLCRVEAVGLCFSDLKLVKQFAAHARKSEIVSGLDPAVLAQVPSYVPGDQPTVPGHETVVRVWAVGEEVERYRPGERYLVQTDYRWLRTENSNAAFGYNLEGALQEFVLVDERVMLSPEGDSMLLPASAHLSASAIALVEPWACVEDAYADRQRRGPKEGGRLLLVVQQGVRGADVSAVLARGGPPAQITWIGAGRPPRGLGPATSTAATLDDAPEGAYDDVVYYGSQAEVLERLFAKLAAHGVLVIALCGGRLGRPVTVPVGRVHYGAIRIVGTAGAQAAEALARAPATAEIRAGDAVNVIGAGGPMGVMHVVRALSLGLEGVSVAAGDMDDERLAALSRIAAPLAKRRGVRFETYNPTAGAPPGPWDYLAIMVPSPALVAQAIGQAREGAIINIFAGIPAEVTAQMDLEAYLRKGLYFVGTSGSTVADMRAVLAKVESGALDTNISVAAVAGLEGAIAGIRAIERREIAGKVIVYPACRGLELTELGDLPRRAPAAAARLDGGVWTKEAEEALLAACGERGA